MMSSLALLIRYQWLQTKNSLREPKAKMKVLLVVAVWIALAFTIGRGIYGVFTYLDEAAVELPGLVRTIEASVLSLLCLGVFFLILTTGLKILYERIFESGDLPFLLSNPISTRTVFAAKFMGSFVYNFLTAAMFILPAWIAYGVKNSASAAFYIAAILAVVLGALLIHSVLALLILLIMRFVPSARLKQLFIGLSSVAALLIVIGSQMMNTRMMQEQLQDPMVFLEQVGQWGIGNNPYLPHLWMSRFALSFLPSFDYSPWANGLPLVLTTLILGYLAINLSGSFFLAGWGTKDDSPRKTVKKAHKSTFSFWPKQSSTAVIHKELLLAKREPLLWYNLAVTSIVLGFFVYNLLSSTPSEEPGMTEIWVMRVLLLIMPAFMGSVLISQLGGLSVSREGKNWWFLCSNPIEPKSMYWGKMAYATMIPALYCVLFQVIIFFLFPEMPLLPLYVSIPAVILINLTVAAVELMLDILFPDFSIKIEFGGTAGKTSGTMKMLSSMFLGFAAMLVFGGTISFPAWGGSVFTGLSTTTIHWITLVAFLIETLMITAIAAKVSIRKLDWLMRNL